MQGRRKINSERRPHVNFRFHHHQAVVILDNGVGGGQAKAAALRFSGEVGVENPFHVFFRYADAFVANADPNVISRREIGNGRSSGGRVTEVFGPDGEGSAIRHRLAWRDDELSDYLATLARFIFSRSP